MPTCRDVNRLIANGSFRYDLTVRNLLVRLHLLFCDECSRFAREIEALGPMAREALSEPLDPKRLAALERAILGQDPTDETD